AATHLRKSRRHPANHGRAWCAQTRSSFSDGHSVVPNRAEKNTFPRWSPPRGRNGAAGARVLRRVAKQYTRRSESTLHVARRYPRSKVPLRTKEEVMVDLTFSTAGVPHAQRLASLREAVSRQFLALSLAPLTHAASSDIDGFMSIRELGGVRI